MLDALKAYNYILFSTLKKNGDFVATPVWFADDGESLYLFSAGNAGKVKRLRNFSDAKVAPCTVTGKRLGEDIDAKAWLLDGEDAKYAHKQLLKRYGWQMRITDIGATLAGRVNKRKFIKVSIAD